MKVIVNGKDFLLEDAAISIADILIKNNVKKPEMVSVQLNEKFVQPELFQSTTVTENDEIDFIYFMGGGQKSQ